jgi:predicted Zn-dependent protease
MGPVSLHGPPQAPPGEPSMPPSARGWAWALCVGLGAAAPVGAEPPAPPSPCEVRALGAEALRQYEAGVAALKRDAREAVPPLRRALVLEPGAAVVRMVLGSALAKTGQPEAAAQEYAAFVAACPQHPRAEQIRHLLADYAQAHAPVTEAPTQVTLTAPAGAAPAQAVSPQRALCDARQLPAAARARYEEGQRRLKQARFAEAAKALEGTLALEPNAAAAHLLLGTTYARLGEAAEGARAYASFVEACPGHPKAPTVRKLLAEYRGAR